MNVRLHARAVAVLAALFAAASPAGSSAADPTLVHERYTLPNGLEVILHPDGRVPLVAVSVWYHVGSGDETPGKSGFAHLFEHMMFQGSEHVGEDRHFQILQKIGASNTNGSTSPDRTNYYEVVPSHQLETALWLESDRMGYMLPLLNEKSLANQREVVRNERRQRYDNVPYGKGRFTLAALLYPEGHPYRYLTIGRHEDLAAASADDVRAFFRTWYVPSNATLTLAGDFDVATAKSLVQKWFGTFPAFPKPARREVAAPSVAGPKRETINDDFARLRRLHYAWHSPRIYGPGDAELDIAASALGASGTGRLYKILVLETQLAQGVSVYQQSTGFSSTFNVVVDLKSETPLEKVERILEEEIERLRAEPITRREFDRAVVGAESSFVWGLESVLARAEALQAYNHYLGSPDSITADLDRYRKSDPEKVRSVAAQTLEKGKRAEVLTLPAKKETK